MLNPSVGLAKSIGAWPTLLWQKAMPTLQLPSGQLAHPHDQVCEVTY